MTSKTIPITSVKTGLSDAIRMAVAAIDDFLGRYYPAQLRAQTQAAKIIAGHWLSRVQGFHSDDDFLHLTRDVLLYVQSGGHRSRISDQLAYFFSGFVPTYGAACAMLEMLGNNQPWADVQAFMHSQSYGNARAYVENFNWAGGQKTATAELQAWVDVLKRQAAQLDEAKAMQLSAGTAAGALPAYAPPATPSFPPAANDPIVPRSAPSLRVVPPGEPVPVGLGARLLPLLADAVIILAEIAIVVMPGNIGQKDTEGEWLRKRDEAAKNKKILVQDVKEQVIAAVNDTNNECKPQREVNQANGAKCENDGYVIMEEALKYKRLVDPPKGRGLDGLFEKLAPDNAPWPFPEAVVVPQPGKLVFIPEEAEPPKVRYDFIGKPPRTIYPRFVVFEAKNVAKEHDDDDTDNIKKETKNRLKNTCDGRQMSVPWTEKRIPQALERQSPGAKNKPSRTAKEVQIKDGGYARWIFVCLPGPVGSNTKLYVLIDVVASGMDLESKTPVPRKPNKPTPDAGY